MENNGKTFDSLPGQRPRPKLGRNQDWDRLTSRYLQDLPKQLKVIRTILEVKDYGAIKKCAHRIKGTSGTYHLDTISKGAAQLERVAGSENPDAIASAIDKVMQLVELETNRLNSHLVSSFDEPERNTNG